MSKPFAPDLAANFSVLAPFENPGESPPIVDSFTICRIRSGIGTDSSDRLEFFEITSRRPIPRKMFNTLEAAFA